MKQILFLLIGFLTLQGYSQNTNPILTTDGATNRGKQILGALVVDSTMNLPVRNHTPIYTNTKTPYKGRIQLNKNTNQFEYHNGTEWVSISGKVDMVKSVSELIAYNGYSETLILSDTAIYNQNGLFRYDVIEREVDSAMVFPATGKGAGYWVRQMDDSPKANYWPVDKNVNDTISALYDGHIIQSKHIAQLRAWQSGGTKITMGFAGSSLMSGTGNEGTNVYGEGSGIIGLTGPTIWGLSIMQADPYFVAPDASVYPVMKPYNNNSISGPTLNSNKIPIPVHYLTTTANPTLAYNISQQGPVLRDSLTVYYLSRTSSQSASFDIVTSEGTTTVDTYEAPTSYTDTLGVVTTVNKTLTLRSKTVAAPASKNYTVTINNIQNDEAGFACIAGFTTGGGVEIHNYGVASSSLVNSYFNEIRGVSAKERMDSIYGKNANVIAVQWIDARDTLRTGYGSTPEAYGRRLDSLVKAIRNWKHEAVVVLVGNPRPFADTTDVETRDDIPVYNQIMRRVAIANNVSFIDLQRMMGDDASLRDDYVHFNAKGYRFEGDGISALFGYPPLKATDDNLLRKGDAYTKAESEAKYIWNQTAASRNESIRSTGTIQLDNSVTSGVTPKIYLPITTGSGTGGSSIEATSITAGNSTRLSGISFNRVGTSDYNVQIYGRNTVQNVAITANSSGSVTLNQTPTTSAGTYDLLTRNTSTGLVEKVASSTFNLIDDNLTASTTRGASKTAINTALELKANAASPTFTGIINATGATTNVATPTYPHTGSQAINGDYLSTAITNLELYKLRPVNTVLNNADANFTGSVEYNQFVTHTGNTAALEDILPPIDPEYIGVTFWFFNNSTESVLISTATGGFDIIEENITKVSYTLPVGEQVTMRMNGTYWVVVANGL